MHKYLGKATIFDLPQGLDQGLERELSTSGHLQQFLFLGEFLRATHTMLSSVKQEHVVSQGPNQFGQQCCVLRQVIGRQGDAEIS